MFASKPTELCANPTSPGDLPLQGYKILVVEDMRINARIVASMLVAEGARPILAASGEEGLTLMASERPDLVLLDLGLPGIDGFETCRRIKRDPRSAATPVIFLTAKTEPEFLVQGFEIGGADYLTKPVQAKEMSARIRTHLKLKGLLEKQEKTIAALSEANRAKNRFLGIAAHDLRNPLVSIRNFAELLAEDLNSRLNGEQLEMLQCILEGSTNMLSLINDLLDVSRIEAGELKLQMQSADIKAVVSRSVAMNQVTARRKGIPLFLFAPEVIPDFPFDARHIHQVVDNLVSNAIKFSPANTAVTVVLEQEKDGVYLRIRDEGPGIPEEERHKLFQDFGRTSVRPTGEELSTGLGLAICQKIVLAHGGTIRHCNREHRGSEFEVRLPQHPHAA